MDLIKELAGLKDTPVPVILVAGGVIFLLLALAGGFAGRIEIPAQRQKWAGAIGALLLIFGTTLYIIPTTPNTRTPTPTDTQPPAGTLACVPSLTSSKAGAELDNGRTDKLDDIIWDFDWSDCEGATQYHLFVVHEGAQFPIIDDSAITSSSYHYVSQGGYIADQNRFNWTWRARAMVNGQ